MEERAETTQHDSEGAASSWVRALKYMALSLALFIPVAAWFIWSVLSGVEERVSASVRQHPIVQERLGEIHDVEVQWVESGRQERANVFIVHVVGARGVGEVTAQFSSQGDRKQSAGATNGEMSIVSGVLEVEEVGLFQLQPQLPFNSETSPK